jgi:NitT/TauT family transport system substrate-binding protein
MSGQIDMGWAAPPFGLREIEEGKIRIIANGNDAPSLRTQTVRVEIANLATLNRKDVMARFMRAYREALDWMYSDPQALKMYAEAIGTTEARARITAEQFQTKAMKQMDRISDIDAVMADGVKLKFLDKPLTKEQLGELIQIPPPAP